ncbi:MAG: asparagine synthase (glutamine-hydrolyzing) [Desulfobacterales bacterium]|jgi:asparagine synthase (glutamine-hydrolysing)|nr:asparagine synthase (glutamine-hydrolyzing) [Desulfobacteraceae bacterium]MBT4363785.1 asparagine synthase (glutamine-hydrolyzing) [Desulfobacteraceae bacterium]MBT7085632.1 asparagine synthase (glutamine-hydrolyzing) [Desulfobacterales bacterium]MBT7696468.1 asparagine synthase (glutamine-hydrolyzing) [Desulfobacterales bacterium]
MCGIHGIVSRSLSGEEIKKRLDQMGNLQRHRGPDDKDEKVFKLKKSLLGFGFVRLSILDLETGMQPIICPKDNSAIICNGQIYNYIELKPEISDEPFISKGDIEVALHLYRRKGLDFLQHLNGMYAGAIYDAAKQKLILFRDRFGIKPLYYTEWDNNFVFSSEIKPLLSGSCRSAELNKERLETYFTYRYLPGEETMFHGIKRLPPGTYLEYDLNNGRYKIKRYWEYKLNQENNRMSLDDAADHFNALFEDSVRIRLRSDVEVGSLLSGGIDSSAVASLAAKSRPDISLFTMSFDEKKYNELPQVKQFLDANKERFSSAKHHIKLCSMETLNGLPDIVRSLEEPVSLGTVLPTDQVCEMAGKKVKVVLTGEGADEIFAGYRKFLVEAAAHQFNFLSEPEQKDLNEIYPELKNYMTERDINPSRRYVQSELLFNSEEIKQLTGNYPTADIFPADALPNLNGSEHPVNAAIAFESRARLPDYVILRLDKLSMRHSLETRTPFLDYRLAEFAASLPVEYKVNLETGRGKFICSYAYTKYNVLDRGTAFRKKQPFTIPLADWLSEPLSLPDFMQEIMLGDVVKKHGILDHKFVKKLVGKVSSEGIGPQTLVSEADRVFAVIVFTMWYNEFFKGESWC